MPILKLSSVAQIDIETTQRLIKRLTELVIAELNVPPQSVNVLIESIDPHSWGVGGQSLKTIVEQGRSDGGDFDH